MFFQLPALSAEQWLIIGGGVGLSVVISFYAIWDAFHRDFGSSNAKLAWVQLSVMVPFFGGLAYLLFGKKRGRKI